MPIDLKDLIEKHEKKFGKHEETPIIPTSYGVTKEKKSEYNKTYYEKTNDRLAEKWKNDSKRKEKLKEYYKNNRERILERAKRWNTKNKEARKLIVERSKKKSSKEYWQIKNK